MGIQNQGSGIVTAELTVKRGLNGVRLAVLGILVGSALA
jgi:hypothetical protein